MNKIKAIGFDYGGVIGGVGSSGVNFNKEAIRILSIPEKEYKETYFSMNHLINLGEVNNWQEFMQLFLKRLNKLDKLDEMVALSNKATELLWNVDADMLDLINKLKQNYKTGLLSNNTIDGAEKMRSQGIDKYFDVFLVSAEIKLMKPSPESFELLCDQLEVNPSELVFIDDSPKSLSTADEIGYTPLLYENLSKLKSDLTSLSIIYK